MLAFRLLELPGPVPKAEAVLASGTVSFDKMKNAIRYLLILPLLAAAAPGFGAEPALEELEQRCQAAREAKLAPLREQAIEDCVAERRSSRTREDCERLYSDFGEGGGTVSGGARPAMFIDLPECVEYFDARDRQRGNGSRR